MKSLEERIKALDTKLGCIDRLVFDSNVSYCEGHNTKCPFLGDIMVGKHYICTYFQTLDVLNKRRMLYGKEK